MLGDRHTMVGRLLPVKQPLIATPSGSEGAALTAILTLCVRETLARFGIEQWCGGQATGAPSVGAEAAAIGETGPALRSGVPGAPEPGASAKLLRSGISWRKSTVTAPTATMTAPARKVSWREAARAVRIAAINVSYAWAAWGPAALSPSRMPAEIAGL